MSKFTTEVRFICESLSGLSESKGFNDVEEIIEGSYAKIFNFDFPIFDETYRSVLEKKILKHFYTREICEETVGLWKLRLNQKLNEIMPYYNQMYNSELIQFNPMYDVDFNKTGTKSGEETGEENSTGQRKMTGTVTDAVTGTVGDSGGSNTSNTKRDVKDYWDYYSDTPQGSVSDLANLTYLTNARHITDDTGGSTSGSVVTDNNTRTYNTQNQRTYNTTQNDTGNKTSNVNTLGEYAEHVIGKMPGVSYSRLLKEFRETFLNIDAMILDDLRVCFFGLWD